MNLPVTISEYSAEHIPSISVVLPVYNGGEYLKLSLQSLLEQDFTNIEILIIDDCSTDGSLDFLKAIRDKRITLFSNQHNQGLFYNLNFLIGKCRSGLIKLWAQDDIMYANCLGVFVNFHAQHPCIGFSYSGRDMIDEFGNIMEPGAVDNTPDIISPGLHARIAYYTGSIAGNIANVCISKKALDSVGLFKEHMKISADFDMWVRLAKDHDTGFIREKIIQLRVHEKQLSRKESLYINHVREDLEVYSYLDKYVTEEQRKEGHKIMRNNKWVFYYTLMMKEFFKGRFKTGLEFARVLSRADNIVLLTLSFIKNKLRRTAGGTKGMTA